MKLMLDCRALARRLSQSQDDAPPRAVRARMRLHLTICQSCRNADEQLRFIRTAMQELQINPPGDRPVAEQAQ